MESELKLNNPECNRCEQPMNYDGRAFFECTRCLIFISSKFFKKNEIGKFVLTSLQKTTAPNGVYKEYPRYSGLPVRVDR